MHLTLSRCLTFLLKYSFSFGLRFANKRLTASLTMAAWSLLGKLRRFSFPLADISLIPITKSEGWLFSFSGFLDIGILYMRNLSISSLISVGISLLLEELF